MQLQLATANKPDAGLPLLLEIKVKASSKKKFSAP
jgi:hypothetical protein